MPTTTRWRSRAAFRLFGTARGFTFSLNNLDFASESERYGRNGDNFYVHRGFLRVWKSILPYIRGALLDLSIREIVSVGYSHGAALALLCHEYVWFERPDLRGRIFGFGFGCPRVIYGRTPREKERWGDFYIIRNYDDIVTHLPPRVLGYRHVGNMVVIGKAGKYSRIDAHRAESYIKELEDYPS